jgi:hypothetical protein
MNERYGPPRWVLLAGALLLLSIAAAVAYNVGLNQGIGGQGATPTTVVYRGWHGFGPLWLLFGFFFFFGFLRSCWWGGGGPRYWSYRRGYRYWDDELPPGFEEWHRRAHERDGSTSSTPGTPGTSGTPGTL